MKFLIILFTIVFLPLSATTLEEQASAKMLALESIIIQLDNKGIDSQKEKLALRTSEVFLKFATWDEANITTNTELFASYWTYKDEAAKMAQDLPDFERSDVIQLLDESIAYAQLLLDEKVFRTPTPKVNWNHVYHDGDQLTYDGRPVFLADYTWKPGTQELTEFYGDKDGFFITPTYVTDKQGTIKTSIINSLSSKADGRPWFIFIANNKVPDWTTTEYGEDFTSYIGDPFYMYDVDHPGAKEMMGYLLDGTVPYMAGKKYTELGYMLCNEPRWITYKNGTQKVWYTSPVSEYTMVKFRTWLQEKYANNIADLNSNWKTSFVSFDKVQLDVPIDISLRGKPVWYDWNTFNDYRAVEWFTWMKARLRESDPNAKAHLKIMPSFFTDNDPAAGIDLEALTEISEINGNDCAAHYNNTRETPEWAEKYILGWRELYMGYDFLKSVRPGNLNFNTESHLLSTGHTRDLYMNPKYVRAVYWAATMLGMDASQTWYWPREADGSIKRNLTNSYPGSNNQQPRVTNEIHNTIMDLNAFSEEIMAFQRERKPLRIFYSKTSAHNRADYMDDQYELYESLNFEGLSLGFATKNIIAQQDNRDWDAILIYKTEYVTQAEMDTLQTYLDNGGTIIMDNTSLAVNEYGQMRYPLHASNGTILRLATLDNIKYHALNTIKNKGGFPKVNVVENSQAAHKGCVWRCVENDEGKQILCIINYGKQTAEIDIEYLNANEGTSCKDLIKGIPVANKLQIEPYDVFFLEVVDAKSTSLFDNYNSDKAQLYPSITDGVYNVSLGQFYDDVHLKVYSMNGALLKQVRYSSVEYFSDSLSHLDDGMYLLSVDTGAYQETFRLLKQS